MKVKKALVIILCTLVVLSPTIALAGCYFYSRTVQSEIVSAKIGDDLGQVTEVRKDDELFKIFTGMFGDKDRNQPTALTALPEKALSYLRYNVTYTDNYDLESAYAYYFSSDASDCYYTDAEQRSFRIARSAAEAFLNSGYSERAYDSAAIPVLKIGGREVKPYTVDWNYKTADGKLTRSSASYSDRAESTTLDGFPAAFGPDFSVKPDTILLKMKNRDDGTVLYEGDYEGLENFTFSGSSVNVSVDMNAVWKEARDKAYAGSADYFFEGSLFGKAAFSISADSVVCGQAVLLNAYNIVDGAEVTVTITPDIGFTPVFYKNGEFWQAILPIPAGAVSEEKTFTVTTSVSSASEVFLLKVSPLTSGTFNYHGESAKSIFTEGNKTELQALVTGIVQKRSADAFPGGKFVLPAENNYYSDSSNYVFGTTVSLRSAGASYRALDRMYCANMGAKDASGKVKEGTKTSVLAAFDGTVIYVGTTNITGRIIVIDHGSGLLTWYTNLSSDIQVKMGDVVKAGQMLCHAADGGLNSDNNFNFHVAATVHGVPIDIEFLINRGLGSAAAPITNE